MLILTRKERQAIVIEMRTDDGRVVPIRVLLISARSGRATLGFEAPEAIRIDREELVTRSTTPTT